MVEVRGVLELAVLPRGGRAAPADFPDALLDELVGREGGWLQGPPVRCHSGGQVQDPATGSHDHPEDEDARGPQGQPDPLLR